MLTIPVPLNPRSRTPDTWSRATLITVWPRQPVGTASTGRLPAATVTVGAPAIDPMPADSDRRLNAESQLPPAVSRITRAGARRLSAAAKATNGRDLPSTATPPGAMASSIRTSVIADPFRPNARSTRPADVSRATNTSVFTV